MKRLGESGEHLSSSLVIGDLLTFTRGEQARIDSLARSVAIGLTDVFSPRCEYCDRGKAERNRAGERKSQPAPDTAVSDANKSEASCDDEEIGEADAASNYGLRRESSSCSAAHRSGNDQVRNGTKVFRMQAYFVPDLHDQNPVSLWNVRIGNFGRLGDRWIHLKSERGPRDFAGVDAIAHISRA